MKKKLLILITFCSALAFAEPKDGEDLAVLDVLKTCKTESQIKSAKFVLTHFSNFHWWDVKAVYDSLHPEFNEWHSSRVLNAVGAGLDNVSKLPFQLGIYNKKNYIDYLAMLAYTSDAPTYVIGVKRAECVSEDTIVLTSSFDARAVVRDEKGYIKKEAFIKNLEVRFVLFLKEEKLYKTIVSFDDKSAMALQKKLIEDIASAPDLAPVEATRITYKELQDRFYLDAGVENPNNK